MINVTEQLKIESFKNRKFYVTAECTLSDGTKLGMKKEDFYLQGNGIVDSSDSSDFPVGVAIEKTATLTLVNDDDRFSQYNFNGARMVLFINIQLSDRLERIRRGTFTVIKKPATAEKIRLTLLDDMRKSDKTYSTNLVFPCSAREVLEDACQQCGIMLGDAVFANSDYIVTNKPENTTFRNVIGAVAALAGGNARIDENDYLRILTFDKEFAEQTNYDGGNLKDYTSGDSLDGGSMNPWTAGDQADGGSLTEGDYHTLFQIKGLQYDVDDVVVTGVKYIEDKQVYQYGTEGYVIKLENMLLKGNIEDGLQRIGAKLIGFRMRPFSCSSIANAYAVFGDPVIFIDAKNRIFRSYLTNVEFCFGGYTKCAGNAKSAEEAAGEFQSGDMAAVEQARKEVEQKMSAYEIALKHMNELAANTLGFYYTQEEQEDGSIIAYRHDKPTLEDSQIIYKSGIAGFFLSVDGGKTWKAGFDSNGDAVLNILYAIGIQAEWINTRGMTAKDNDGNITFRVDADTGKVYIHAAEFELTGKTMEEIIRDNAEKYVDNAITEYDTTLGQDEIFNKLTNGGQEQGIYIQNGKLYINANYILAGVLAGNRINARGLVVYNNYNQKTLEVDSNGNVIITPQSFALTNGDTIYSVAGDALSDAKSYADGLLGSSGGGKTYTQQELFNILTNNGQTQGIYLYGGKIYINASYIDTGYLAGWRVDSANDCLYTGSTAGGVGFTLWGSGKIQSVGSTYRTSIEGGILETALANISILKVTQSAEFTGTSSNVGTSFSQYNTIFDGTYVTFNASQVAFNSAGGSAPKFMKPPQIFNLTHVTSGGHLVFGSDGSTIAYLASSSKRYKVHISDMSVEEAERILQIPVVWFRYKDGYLAPDDRMNGQKVPGFYAEDIHEIFPEAAQLNEEGEPEDWNYRTLIPAMLKVIQNQEKRITELEKMIKGG